MATKVPTRNIRLRRSGSRASHRPRKRQRTVQPDASQPTHSAENNMASALNMEARRNAARNVTGQDVASSKKSVAKVTETPRKTKVGNGEIYSSSAKAYANDRVNNNKIDEEFKKHLTVCGVDEFLTKYIPCSDDSMPTARGIAGVFSGVNRARKEERMYPPFANGLRRLVASFPQEKRIASFITANVVFSALHSAHHPTQPDLTSALPGDDKPAKWSWNEAALVWELKLKAKDDPIDSKGNIKEGEDYTSTRAQLYKAARNLFMAHLSCFVFVVGVYGPMMRFYRFDHSGIIASDAFNYTTLPQHTQAFLWRLANPLPYDDRPAPPGTIVGADPTITKPSDEEFEHYFGRLIKKCPELASERADIRGEALLINAGIDVDDADGAKVLLKNVPSSEYILQDGATICPVKCFAFEVLHDATTVVGRATHVFKILILGSDPSEDQICTLKDAWQQRTRDHEGMMYKRVKANARNPKVQGELMASPVLKLDMTAPDAMEKSGLANHIGTFNMSYCEGAEAFGLITQSARLYMRGRIDVDPDAEPSLFDRTRIRSIMTNIGRPLTTFRCTKELVMALTDAVKGLEFLRICGIMHRDVSSGNILLNDTKRITGGFLHDLDYSTCIACAADAADPKSEDRVSKHLKDMTGTRPFMAMGILESDNMREPHVPHHDLESVFWVAMWCILRHSDHTHRNGADAASKLFDVDDILSTKISWFSPGNDFAIRDNRALSELVQELRRIFKHHNSIIRASYISDGLPTSHVSAEKLFEILTNALEDEEKIWPDDDKSQVFHRPESATTGTKRKQADSKTMPSKSTKSSKLATPGNTHGETEDEGNAR